MRPGFGIRNEEYLDFGIGEDDRGDIPSFSHDIALGTECLLAPNHIGPDLRDARDDRDIAVDLGRAYCIAHVLAVEKDLCLLGKGAELDLCFLCTGGKRLGILEVDALALGTQGAGAIHRSGIEIGQSTLLRQRLCDCRLARACRSVDSNPHLASPSQLSRSFTTSSSTRRLTSSGVRPSAARKYLFPS